MAKAIDELKPIRYVDIYSFFIPLSLLPFLGSDPFLPGETDSPACEVRGIRSVAYGGQFVSPGYFFNGTVLPCYASYL